MNENVRKEVRFVILLILLFGFITLGSMITKFQLLDLLYFLFLIYVLIKYLYIKLSHRLWFFLFEKVIIYDRIFLGKEEILWKIN